MKTYVYVNEQDFVTQRIVSPVEQVGAIEIDWDMGTSPGDGYQYNINTREWVDTRTEQQKYQDAAMTVLQQRNKMLYSTDWTQIPNNPLTSEKQQEWATYRQELRDVPEQQGYPYTVVWPVPPT